ncbi:MAG: pyridoxamine 5'-phosphate oxidase family protein [Candidatus Omnitrophica bacterium]|nr:pyridoxamine 5'-phosphate oxidase family protein [Candidatus Omnitrophota bacterium]
MLSKKIQEFLKDREFISVATSDFNGRPNAAPKFVLKIENNFIYLVDYSLSRTWENLKANPRVSLSFVDTETLSGYQINGPVEIVDKGAAYEKLLNELREKEISLSVKRIIEGVHKEKSHQSFEVSIPERFAIFKVKMEEIAEIGPKGEVKREKV